MFRFRPAQPCARSSPGTTSAVTGNREGTPRKTGLSSSRGSAIRHQRKSSKSVCDTRASLAPFRFPVMFAHLCRRRIRRTCDEFYRLGKPWQPGRLGGRIPLPCDGGFFPLWPDRARVPDGGSSQSKDRFFEAWEGSENGPTPRMTRQEALPRGQVLCGLRVGTGDHSRRPRVEGACGACSAAMRRHLATLSQSRVPQRGSTATPRVSPQPRATVRNADGSPVLNRGDLKRRSRNDTLNPVNGYP